MKRLLMAAALGVATLAASAPAFAQAYQQPAPGYGGPAYGGPGRGGPVPVGPMRGGPVRGGYDRNTFWNGAPQGPAERIDWLQQHIDRGVADGSINRPEARRVQRELNVTRRMAMTMRQRDGGRLNDTDRAYIQERLQNVSQRIRWSRRNGY